MINAVRKEEKKSRIKGGGGNGGVRAWEQVLYYLSWCELDLSVTCCLLLASKSMGHFKFQSINSADWVVSMFMPYGGNKL